MFKLTEDYKTGIVQIDEEHAYLVQLINSAMEMLHEEQIDVSKFAEELIKKLKNYAAEHFAHEEAYMEEINDKELERQKKEHAEFIKKVNSFTVDANTTVTQMEELLQFMVRWIFAHILSSDMMIGHETATKQKDPFAFTKEYETGIEFIDQQHEMLFSIIRRTNDLVHEELLHDKYDKILEILDELKSYTEMHFHEEEEHMQKIGYPKLEEQQIAHSAFIEKLVHISISEMDSIDENQQEYLLELIAYLLDWLTNHILHSDKQIGEWERKTQ